MNELIDAVLFGIVIAICFPIGALLSLKLNLGHQGTAAFMSLGAGLLIAAALMDLVHTALDELDIVYVVATIAFAAAVFSTANWLLAKQGAKHRKRCETCVSGVNEDQSQGSGLSIALGTVLDALPEALVLGVTLTGNASIYPLVIALGLGNIAQSISSTSGLSKSGYSLKSIMSLWITLAITVVLVTMVSFSVLGVIGDAFKPWVEAFAAGILLAMVCEAMLPEAYHESPSFSGLIGAVGVCMFIIVHGIF